MRDLGKVLVNIPARAGSKRVKAKNLRDLCGSPLLSYAINCAKQCVNAEDVYVNSDSKEMLALGDKMGVSTYRRSAELASDTASGDMFTFDFINNVEVDTLIMISPVCPLITADDVTRAMSAYANSTCDTLISCESTQMQGFFEERPININELAQLAPTQNNTPIKILNWAVTIWDAKSFQRHYSESGYAYLGKNRLLFPIDPLHGVKISTEADFRMVESIMRGLMSNSSRL